MTRKLGRYAAGTLAVLVCFFGCDAVIGPTDTGSLVVESSFSDAPVSPGGTGGVSGAGLTGADDVELQAEATRSFFTAFQIDPISEDTAGPKFVDSADVDQDGLLDLVSAWNQSQPIQLHLQRRDADGTISFRTISLGGTSPIAVVAGIKLAQIDDDGWLDIVVLIKATGAGAFCPTNPPTEVSRLEGEIMVMFSPGDAAQIPDGDRWTQMLLVNPFVQDRWIHNQFPGAETISVEEAKSKPESSGFTSLAVGDVDGQPGDDIIVALNPATCKELGQETPLDTVDLWVNPGPGLARFATAWGAPPPAGISSGVPVTIMSDAPQVKDVKLVDVDADGDLDVVATWTNSLSRNVVWARNPLVPHQTGGIGGAGAVVAGVVPGADLCTGGANDGGPCVNGDVDCLPDGVCVPGRFWHFATDWELRPVGQVDTGADILAIGDIDRDGFDDVVVRSTDGQIVQWFRRPSPLSVDPEFPPNDPVPDRFNFPWPVFTVTEFDDQTPAAVSLGDLTGNGQLDMVISVEGGVFWYDGTVGDSVFDPWLPSAIVQDSVSASSSTAAPGAGVGVQEVGAATSINTLLIVDLDQDGRNDIIGTLDRQSGSGLSDDRLVWYRNVRTDNTTGQ